MMWIVCGGSNMWNVSGVPPSHNEKQFQIYSALGAHLSSPLLCCLFSPLPFQSDLPFLPALSAFTACKGRSILKETSCCIDLRRGGGGVATIEQTQIGVKSSSRAVLTNSTRRSAGWRRWAEGGVGGWQEKDSFWQQRQWNLKIIDRKPQYLTEPQPPLLFFCFLLLSCWNFMSTSSWEHFLLVPLAVTHPGLH